MDNGQRRIAGHELLVEFQLGAELVEGNGLFAGGADDRQLLSAELDASVRHDARIVHVLDGHDFGHEPGLVDEGPGRGRLPQPPSRDGQREDDEEVEDARPMAQRKAPQGA